MNRTERYLKALLEKYNITIERHDELQELAITIAETYLDPSKNFEEALKKSLELNPTEAMLLGIFIAIINEQMICFQDPLTYNKLANAAATSLIVKHKLKKLKN